MQPARHGFAFQAFPSASSDPARWCLFARPHPRKSRHAAEACSPSPRPIPTIQVDMHPCIQPPANGPQTALAGSRFGRNRGHAFLCIGEANPAVATATFPVQRGSTMHCPGLRACRAYQTRPQDTHTHIYTHGTHRPILRSYTLDVKEHAFHAVAVISESCRAASAGLAWSLPILAGRGVQPRQKRWASTKTTKLALRSPLPSFLDAKVDNSERNRRPASLRLEPPPHHHHLN
jgi:hypothetical protein